LNPQPANGVPAGDPRVVNSFNSPDDHGEEPFTDFEELKRSE
jgi:hypothetical protein